MIFDDMRTAVAEFMPKIYNLPFNQELAQGSLAREKFIFYLHQDALYLADFSEALVLTATRLPDNHQSELLIQFAMNAIKTERELHSKILKTYFPVANNLLALHEQSPFCLMYTNYLLRLASSAPVEVAVAGLTPCFWVYRQLGEKAIAQKSANNPYQAWINLYTNPEFSHAVDLVITILNKLADNATTLSKKNMLTAFKRATQLEYQFCQGAYLQESWQI